MLNFQLKTGHGALSNEYGTLFLPVDPANAYNVVTLHGVFSRLSNEHIQSQLSAYGEVGSIHRGFHWTQGVTIENGKIYIIFKGTLHKQIPSRLELGHFMVSVRYIGQPQLCTVCGIAGHRYPLCKKGIPQPESLQLHSPSTPHSMEVPEFSVAEDGINQTQDLQPKDSAESDIVPTTSIRMQTVDCIMPPVAPQVSNVGVLVKPKTRDIGFTIHPAKCNAQTMTNKEKMNRVSRECNTDHIQYKGVRTQTECQSKSVSIQSETQTFSRHVQTMSIEQEAEQCRKVRKVKIIRKRKRATSGSISNISKEYKSRKICSSGIRQYFEERHPVTQQPGGGTQSTPQGSLGSPRCEFNFDYTGLSDTTKIQCLAYMCMSVLTVLRDK